MDDVREVLDEMDGLGVDRWDDQSGGGDGETDLVGGAMGPCARQKEEVLLLTAAVPKAGVLRALTVEVLATPGRVVVPTI